MVCETHLTTYINLFLEAIISVSRGLFCREPYRVSNSLANVESTTPSSLLHLPQMHCPGYIFCTYSRALFESLEVIRFVFTEKKNILFFISNAICFCLLCWGYFRELSHALSQALIKWQHLSYKWQNLSTVYLFWVTWWRHFMQLKDPYSYFSTLF